MKPEELNLIAAAIAAFAPVITSLLRRLIGDYVPRAALPVVAGAAGTGLALLSDATIGSDLGPVLGATLGLASTGLRDIVHIAKTDGVGVAGTHVGGFLAIVGISSMLFSGGCAPKEPVHLGGAVGAVGCAVAASKISPSEKQIALTVVGGVQDKLRNEPLTATNLSVLLNQIEDPAIQAGVAVLLLEVYSSIDASQVVAPDSQEYQVVDAFLTACKLALGDSTPIEMQSRVPPPPANELAVEVYEQVR